MTWLVVCDDDTLRDRLAWRLDDKVRRGSLSGEALAAAVLGVLRDVGTPATTERSCGIEAGHEDTPECRSRTRLVTGPRP